MAPGGSASQFPPRRHRADLRPRVFERYRKAARHAAVVIATGRVERQGPVVHVTATALAQAPPLQAPLATRSRDFH